MDMATVYVHISLLTYGFNLNSIRMKLPGEVTVFSIKARVGGKEL